MINILRKQENIVLCNGFKPLKMQVQAQSTNLLVDDNMSSNIRY